MNRVVLPGLLAGAAILGAALPALAAEFGSPGRMIVAQAAAPATISATTDPTTKADPDMAKVLAALKSLDGKPIESLDAKEARGQPSAADAVKKVIKDENIKADPHAGISVSNKHFADWGKLRLRVYSPEKGENHPIIVYFRGGGFVIADLDTYDTSASALARKAGAVVVSVDYPMAPEHKFPASHDEAVEAYKYVVKNAQSLGGDPSRIAIVGESAGGNLAINTAIAARDGKMQMPVGVVAVYPMTGVKLDTPSYTANADAKPLNRAMMAWFFQNESNSDADKGDARLDIIGKADLKGLPPVTVINAEIDPLLSDGQMLVEKLKAAGVPTEAKVFDGVTHEFFGMDAVVAKAREAQDFAVAQLKADFAKPAPVAVPAGK